MPLTGTLITFMIVSFSLAAVVILQKDSIPQPFRKILALFTLLFIVSSFVMFMVTLFTLG